MFKTKYKNYYFWLSFVTSIFGPCIIMNPKIKLFWNSSIASNIGYMVLLIICLVTSYLKPELLYVSGYNHHNNTSCNSSSFNNSGYNTYNTELLHLNVDSDFLHTFLTTMLVIIPLTSIVSWILVIYSKDEYRQPFDSKYLGIRTPGSPKQINSVKYTKNGQNDPDVEDTNSIQILISNVFAIADTDELIIESINEI